MTTVIFDMDGVILDSESVCVRCWRDYAAKYGLKNVDAMFRECIGTTLERTREIVRRYEGEDFPFEEFWRETSARFHGIEADESLPVKRGARELLEFLKNSGVRLGLASSTKSQTVIRQLTHAGVADYFDVIVGGEMTEKSKPEPDIYLEACRRLGVRPQEAYGVEDSFNGVRSLAAAGMFAIMVPDLLKPDEEMRQKAGLICKDLLEVRDFFRERIC